MLCLEEYRIFQISRFWGATVITNLLSPFPCLIEWICGGFYISNPTQILLKVFYLKRCACCLTDLYFEVLDVLTVVGLFLYVVGYSPCIRLTF